MKNLFLSLALLIGSFAFANNTSQINLSSIESQKIDSVLIGDFDLDLTLVGTCYITINSYDVNDNLVFSQVLQIDNVVSAEQCDEIAGEVAVAFEEIKK